MIPRSPGAAATSRQLSGPAMRSTARLAYGAASRVSTPAASALPPVSASDRCEPAMPSRSRRWASRNSARSASSVPIAVAAGSWISISGQPAAARSRRSALRAVARSSVARLRAPAAVPSSPAVYGPGHGLLDGVVGQALGGGPGTGEIRVGGRAAVGDRVQAGRLLGADGGLDERVPWHIDGEWRPRQGSEQRGEHRGRSVTAAWRPHRPGGGCRLIRCPPARALATGSGSAGRGRAACGCVIRDSTVDGHPGRRRPRAARA